MRGLFCARVSRFFHFFLSNYRYCHVRGLRASARCPSRLPAPAGGGILPAGPQRRARARASPPARPEGAGAGGAVRALRAARARPAGIAAPEPPTGAANPAAQPRADKGARQGCGAGATQPQTQAAAHDTRAANCTTTPIGFVQLLTRTPPRPTTGPGRRG